MRGRGSGQPISNELDGNGDFASVRPDVLASDVRTKALIAKRLPIEDDATLGLIPGITKRFRTEKETQLEGHVETRKIGPGIGLYA